MRIIGSKALVPVIAVVVVIAAYFAVAGPLDPPAGPVTSTYKTLVEVEPRIAINAVNTRGGSTTIFRITQPGSYYLPGNVTGTSGRNGIEIASDNVTIDLMGFTLQGVAGSLNGITATAVHRNIAIRNGTVTGWGEDGVNIQGGAPPEAGSTIEHLMASSNGGSGIRTGLASVVRHCTSNNNGFFGISAHAGSVISHCVAYENGGNGISTANFCTVTHCVGRNGLASGISVGAASVVSHSVAASNTVVGIRAGNGSTISHCSTYLNGEAGIEVPGTGLVLHNQCHDNVGPGIEVVTDGARIEGNNCTGNAIGMHVDGVGNIIIRNTCSGNSTNWDIVANNVVGPILDRTAPASAAIFGDAAPDSTGSTHPNANFTY